MKNNPSFLNKLQAHRGELIKLTSSVRWTLNSGISHSSSLDESLKEKVFLLIDVVGNKKGKKYPVSASTFNVGHGENRYVNLLIEEKQTWMIVSELDVEFILPGEV
jgi:hypothetical protein